MKPLVFMSGQLSTVAVLSISEDWGFTRVARRASACEQGFQLEGMLQTWKGGVYYAADPDITRAAESLKILSNFACWPDPQKLLRMVDRHEVAKECFHRGFFVDDPCEISAWDDYIDRNSCAVVDSVVKHGNEHSGEGKILVRKGMTFPKWDGIGTIQPFFVGRSIRVLHIGSAVFFVETVNDSSWIKNSAGGENVKFDARSIPHAMLEHSFNVRDYFGLDVCGNDYILSDDGSFHFLETNQFPGLGDDFLGDLPRDFFRERMRSLEKIVVTSKDVLRPTMPTAR